MTPTILNVRVALQEDPATDHHQIQVATPLDYLLRLHHPAGETTQPIRVTPTIATQVVVHLLRSQEMPTPLIVTAATPIDLVDLRTPPVLKPPPVDSHHHPPALAPPTAAANRNLITPPQVDSICNVYPRAMCIQGLCAGC